jgi:hypothetical protein
VKKVQDNTVLDVYESNLKEQQALKSASNCLNTNIYSYKKHLLVKVLIYISMLFIFPHQCQLYICGTL